MKTFITRNGLIYIADLPEQWKYIQEDNGQLDNEDYDQAYARAVEEAVLVENQEKAEAIVSSEQSAKEKDEPQTPGPVA